MLLALGVWGGVAWAGLSEDEVVAEAIRVQADLGGRLLLATVGPDAEKLAERMVRTNLTLQAEVVQLPTAGDPVRELWAALNQAGLRCALRLSTAESGDGWLLTPFGNCSPLAPPPLSTDTLATATVQAVVFPEAAAARFVERRLSLMPSTGSATGGWDVQDGAGTRLSAPGFSSLVRDNATTEYLLREQRSALRAHTALRITGGVLVASALVPLVNNPGLTTAEGEDRAWTALFLAGTGALAYLVAPQAIDAVNDRQRYPARYYTQAQASEWVTVYNTQLQQDLGLAPPEPTPESSSGAAEDAMPEPEPEPEPEVTP